jgi:hypothetical protein
MLKKNSFRFLALLATSAVLLAGGVGCEQLPGTSKQQGAVIGGAGGAVAGAAIGGERHRLLGAVLGGAIGAGGGYVVGANSDRIIGRDSAGAQEAMRRAETAPATAQQALNAPTADLNNDGFVTMDEVVAMRQAGLSDQAILQKLQATGQVFELSPDQQNFLRNNGVSDYVIGQMPEINRQVRDRLLSQPPLSPTGTIGQPPPAPRY